MSILKDFFSWSKKERSAIIFLLILLIFLFLGDIYFNRLFPTQANSIHPDSLAIYEERLLKLENDLVDDKKKTDSISSKLEIRNFDPNELIVEQWKDLGFSEKQSISIVNYGKSIGGFKSKSDLASSFVINEKKFQELEKYIVFSVKKETIIEEKEKIIFQKTTKSKPLKERAKIRLDLNSSDSLELLSLHGIGPYYAHKIIEYRNQLGGYVAKDQLLEIWNFDIERLSKISTSIYVDLSKVRKLKLNSDSLELFWKHPYIDWKRANVLVNYRNQNGEFEEVEGIKAIKIISDSLYNQLYPYLSLE